MGKQFIVVSSITYAYKGKDILERRGCKAFIEKAPRSISECGCLYSLVIRGCTLENAVSILKAANIKIIRTGSDENDLPR
jgi:hypothetical protein